eukprot:SAG22_NODE_4766_length_1170_cov_1.328665_1_plen_305_part_00
MSSTFTNSSIAAHHALPTTLTPCFLLSWAGYCTGPLGTSQPVNSRSRRGVSLSQCSIFCDSLAQCNAYAHTSVNGSVCVLYGTSGIDVPTNSDEGWQGHPNSNVVTGSSDQTKHVVCKQRCQRCESGAARYRATVKFVAGIGFEEAELVSVTAEQCGSFEITVRHPNCTQTCPSLESIGQREGAIRGPVEDRDASIGWVATLDMSTPWTVIMNDVHNQDRISLGTQSATYPEQGAVHFNQGELCGEGRWSARVVFHVGSTVNLQGIIGAQPCTVEFVATHPCKYNIFSKRRACIFFIMLQLTSV